MSARLYCGSALRCNVSSAVSILAGGLALASLFTLYVWAVSLGLGGN